MIIFWLALVISALLSIFIAFRVPDMNGWAIFFIVSFFIGSHLAIIEILKWPLGKKTIDNSKGLSKRIFGETTGALWGYPIILPKESIISVQGRGKRIVWGYFVSSIYLVVTALINLFKW